GYAAASNTDRAAMREWVGEFEHYFWAATPAEGATSAETLRLWLIRFALFDQYPDSRDAVLELEDLCPTRDVSARGLAARRQEVTAMANHRNRYGFGSTRSMLLRGYGEYGRRGRPKRNG